MTAENSTWSVTQWKQVILSRFWMCCSLPWIYLPLRHLNRGRTCKKRLGFPVGISTAGILWFSYYMELQWPPATLCWKSPSAPLDPTQLSSTLCSVTEKCITWLSLPSDFLLLQANRRHWQGTYSPGPFLLDLGWAVFLPLHLRPQAPQEAPSPPWSSGNCTPLAPPDQKW